MLVNWCWLLVPGLGQRLTTCHGSFQCRTSVYLTAFVRKKTLKDLKLEWKSQFFTLYSCLETYFPHVFLVCENGLRSECLDSHYNEDKHLTKCSESCIYFKALPSDWINIVYRYFIHGVMKILKEVVGHVVITQKGRKTCYSTGFNKNLLIILQCFFINERQRKRIVPEHLIHSVSHLLVWSFICSLSLPSFQASS